ncbi:MAG: chorismate synthase [Geobacteraceae bacterium]|nr:chorismate synthase [Geobacteraceae bacterium]
MIRYLTAGESHGPQLTAIIEGLPAGLKISDKSINADLARRQGGYGRGGRMQIEKDTAEILSGVRWGETIGSPVTLAIRNRDWENWKDKMSPAESARDEKIRVTRSRPGHADLSGVMKYRHRDVRNVLERSSARETAIRVAVGAVAKAFLAEFGIQVLGYVTAIGSITAASPDSIEKNIREVALNSDFYTVDSAAESRMKTLVDRARESGDSVGGVIEVAVSGVPAGLGSHVHWDRKLDARLAMAAMSVQAIKGVEIGMGFESAARPGSMVHDEIYYDSTRISRGEVSGYYRKTNNAGGIEGGITNGESIIVRAAMKPIPTLYKPLMSVDLSSREPIEATVERSDVCAVPAATVVMEAVVAIEIANAFLEKFAGDSMEETRSNFAGYLEYLKSL